MQQIKLTEYTESYAVSIEHALPKDGPVFFKTKDGRTFEGEFFEELEDIWDDHFDNLKGYDFEPEEILSWHPVTVDM